VISFSETQNKPSKKQHQLNVTIFFYFTNITNKSCTCKKLKIKNNWKKCVALHPKMKPTRGMKSTRHDGSVQSSYGSFCSGGDGVAEIWFYHTIHA